MKKLLAIILVVVLTATMFTSCASIDKALLSTYLNLGEKYLLDLDYEQAIVYFNKVIEVEPRNSRAYMGAAEAYVGLGDVESAIELLRTALDVFSDDEEVTIELLEMLIEIDPATSEWYITLADIYEGREDTGSAIAVLSDGVNAVTDSDSLILLLQRLIALDPANVDWYLDLAQVYVDAGNRTSAISTLKQGMDDVGDDKTKLYDKLIEIDSGTTDWYFELAEVYEDKNNISSAVDTLELGLNSFEDDTTKIDFSEELIEIDETNAEWYLTIAYIYIDQSNTESAIAILREGLEKASDTTEIEALLEQLSPDLTGFVTTSYYIYDEDGNLVNSYEYSQSGMIQVNTGKIYYADGTTSTSLHTREYDSNGNLVRENDEYDSFIQEYIHEYDSNGNRVKTVEVDYYPEDYKNTFTTTYEYNSNGDMISRTQTSVYNSGSTYASTSTSTYRYEYEYDTDGNLLVRIERNADGSYYNKTEYEYDSHGNISKRTYTWGTDSSTTTYWVTYDCDYDSDGNVVKTVSNYSADGYGASFEGSDGELHELASYTTENEYDEESLTSKTTITQRSTDGTVMVTTNEYTYDAYGSVISRSETVDGVTTTYVLEHEYEYGSDGKVQKCVITWYYADTGNIYSVTTMERIN
ncbi:MAG: tetratricopeptide repeat protein [Oscillospiraceae bacterium]|nr:tetratricopeptide repeat protein [Oscillospiraceae bacterium]